MPTKSGEAVRRSRDGRSDALLKQRRELRASSRCHTQTWTFFEKVHRASLRVQNTYPEPHMSSCQESPSVTLELLRRAPDSEILPNVMRRRTHTKLLLEAREEVFCVPSKNHSQTSKTSDAAAHRLSQGMRKAVSQKNPTVRLGYHIGACCCSERSSEEISPFCL